jgi:hypothetical protein
MKEAVGRKSVPFEQKVLDVRRNLRKDCSSAAIGELS